MHDSVDIILTEVNMLSLDLFAQNRLSNIPCYSLHLQNMIKSDDNQQICLTL